MTTSADSDPLAAGVDSARADILVVDDNPANIELLVAILGSHGHRCRVANNGLRAIAAAQADVPELVMLDIAMPKMDGYEVCRRLKAEPSTQAVPVIFLSALNGVIDKVQAFDAGAADYVSKPFQIEEVMVRVAHQIRLSRLQRVLVARNATLAKLNAELLETKAHLETVNTSLQRLSEVDGLTGVANRRHFDARLNHGLAQPGDFGLALIDIDFFKQFNDRHGHLAGDACLRHVATALTMACPPGALLARFGGEEFAVLLPGLGLSASRVVAEALRQTVADLVMDAGCNGVTISVGVAARATGEWSPNELLARADGALYRAKSEGRNCVRSA